MLSLCSRPVSFRPSPRPSRGGAAARAFRWSARALRGRRAVATLHDRCEQVRIWLPTRRIDSTSPCCQVGSSSILPGCPVTAGHDARPRGDVATVDRDGWHRPGIVHRAARAILPDSLARASGPLDLSPEIGSAEGETIEQFSRILMKQFQYEPAAHLRSASATRCTFLPAEAPRALEVLVVCSPEAR